MLVCLEGLDATGKSTHAKMLAESEHMDLLRFPDRTTPIGRLIDGYLKGNGLIFQALQLANRAEHIQKLNRWADDGERCHCVRSYDATGHTGLVLDRYWPSGVAYGKSDGLDESYLIRIHAGLPAADLYILLDLPAEIAHDRVKMRAEEKPDVYELRPLEHFKSIREDYLRLWNSRQAKDSRWSVVRADRPPEQVHQEIVDLVNSIRG